MKHFLFVPVVAALILIGCTAPTAPPLSDRMSTVGLARGVDGRVVWLGFEGGFWAIETTDGRVLDPHESLPATFRTDGLKVHVAARALEGDVCFHQAGIIVDVTEIGVR